MDVLRSASEWHNHPMIQVCSRTLTKISNHMLCCHMGPERRGGEHMGTVDGRRVEWREGGGHGGAQIGHAVGMYMSACTCVTVYNPTTVDLTSVAMC